MGFIPLNDLKEGNIVLPFGGQEMIYVTEIGRSADRTVVNYAGYPVTDTVAFVSGANVLEISQDDLASGSQLRDLGINKPAILVGNNLRRVVNVDEDNYTADFKAHTNPLVMQEVVSIMRQTGANEERIETNRSPRGMDFSRLADGNVVGEGRFRDRSNDEQKGSRPPKQQPARTESIVLDMYLEDAVTHGLLDRKTYTVLQFARDEIVTLQDAWNAARDGTLDVKLGLKKTFDQAFPAYNDTRKPQKNTLVKREEDIGQNPVLTFSGKLGLDVELLSERGLIYDRTEEIITFSIEPSDSDGFLRYDKAMRSMIARGFKNLKDPKTGEALSEKELAAVKKDIAECYSDLQDYITEGFNAQDLESIRQPFMVLATSSDKPDNILRHHDFSKPVVKSLRARVEVARAEIIANRPPALDA